MAANQSGGGGALRISETVPVSPKVAFPHFKNGDTGTCVVLANSADAPPRSGCAESSLRNVPGRHAVGRCGAWLEQRVRSSWLSGKLTHHYSLAESARSAEARHDPRHRRTPHSTTRASLSPRHHTLPRSRARPSPRLSRSPFLSDPSSTFSLRFSLIRVGRRTPCFVRACVRARACASA